MQRDPIPLHAEPVYAEPVYHYDPVPDPRIIEDPESVEESVEEFVDTTGGPDPIEPKQAKRAPKAKSPLDPYHQVKSQGKAVKAQSARLDAINEDLTEIKEAIRQQRRQKGALNPEVVEQVEEVEERDL